MKFLSYSYLLLLTSTPLARSQPQCSGTYHDDTSGCPSLSDSECNGYARYNQSYYQCVMYGALAGDNDCGWGDECFGEKTSSHKQHNHSQHKSILSNQPASMLRNQQGNCHGIGEIGCGGFSEFECNQRFKVDTVTSYRYNCFWGSAGFPPEPYCVQNATRCDV